MSENLYTTVPEAPEHLGSEVRKTWYMAGLKLVKEKRFDNDAYRLLSDICYWEEQKLSTLERLRAVQAGPGSVTPKMTRSVALKNLKTIKAEIDQLRSELNLEQNESAWISDSHPIPDDAYESMQARIAEICGLAGDADKRDLFLLTLLPALSAHLPNVVAEHADGFYSSSVSLFLLDESGRAERFAALMRRLSLTDHENGPQIWPSAESVLQKRETEPADFRMRSHAIYDSDLHSVGEKDGQDEQRFATQEQLINFAFDIENLQPGKFITTLSNVIIGSLSDYRMARSRFDSTTLSSFLMYCGPRESEWRSHRPDAASRALNQNLLDLGRYLNDLSTTLLARTHPLIVELTDAQWQMIDETFAEKMEIVEELALPDELKKSTRKAAIYTVKMTMLWAVIRRFDEDPQLITEDDFVVAADDDVIASLWIADTCLKHAIRVFEQVPVEAQPDAKGSRYHRFYNVLPPAFETSEAVELAERMNIATRTAKRYLNTLIDERKLTRIRKGVYEKVG